MPKYVKSLFFLYFFVVVSCPAADIPENCKKYTSFGYGYYDFFRYNPREQIKNLAFYLDFFVKTTSDAHLLLKKEIQADEGYEIVIGGGQNTFCQLRLIQGSDKTRIATYQTKPFLSNKKWMKFRVSIDNRGVITVENDEEILLKHLLNNPPTIRYFAVGSWANTKADWRLNCVQKPKEESVKDEKIEASTNPLRNLKTNLFSFYDPYSIPNEIMTLLEVTVNFRIKNILMEDDRGELKVYGVADMKWVDRKMKWKPENYSGISSIYVPSFQIWTPNLRVLNSIASGTYPQLLNLESSGVLVSHDGSVSWRPSFKSSSFCWPDFKDWPTDAHNCTVLFGFWMEPPNLSLVVMNEYETIQASRVEGKWKVLEVVPFNGDFSDPDIYGGLHVALQRKYADNIFFFYIIYTVAVSLSLSSFWVSSGCFYKLHLICGSIILLILMMFCLVHNIPKIPKDAPKLILIHSWTTVIACFPLLVFVTLKNLPKSIPDSLLNLLDHAILDRMFCLTLLPENPSQYADLILDENKLTKVSLKVVRLAILIERFSFFVYLILLILPFVLL